MAAQDPLAKAKMKRRMTLGLPSMKATRLEAAAMEAAAVAHNRASVHHSTPFINRRPLTPEVEAQLYSACRALVQAHGWGVKDHAYDEPPQKPRHMQRQFMETSSTRVDKRAHRTTLNVRDPRSSLLQSSAKGDSSDRSRARSDQGLVCSTHHRDMSTGSDFQRGVASQSKRQSAATQANGGHLRISESPSRRRSRQAHRSHHQPHQDDSTQLRSSAKAELRMDSALGDSRVYLSDDADLTLHDLESLGDDTLSHEPSYADLRSDLSSREKPMSSATTLTRSSFAAHKQSSPPVQYAQPGFQNAILFPDAAAAGEWIDAATAASSAFGSGCWSNFSESNAQPSTSARKSHRAKQQRERQRQHSSHLDLNRQLPPLPGSEMQQDGDYHPWDHAHIADQMRTDTGYMALDKPLDNLFDYDESEAWHVSHESDVSNSSSISYPANIHSIFNPLPATTNTTTASAKATTYDPNNRPSSCAPMLMAPHTITTVTGVGKSRRPDHHHHHYSTVQRALSAEDAKRLAEQNATLLKRRISTSASQQSTAQLRPSMNISVEPVTAGRRRHNSLRPGSAQQHRYSQVGAPAQQQQHQQRIVPSQQLSARASKIFSRFSIRDAAQTITDDAYYTDYAAPTQPPKQKQKRKTSNVTDRPSTSPAPFQPRPEPSAGSTRPRGSLRQTLSGLLSGSTKAPKTMTAATKPSIKSSWVEKVVGGGGVGKRGTGMLVFDEKLGAHVTRY